MQSKLHQNAPLIAPCAEECDDACNYSCMDQTCLIMISVFNGLSLAKVCGELATTCDWKYQKYQWETSFEARDIEFGLKDGSQHNRRSLDYRKRRSNCGNMETFPCPLIHLVKNIVTSKNELLASTKTSFLGRYWSTLCSSLLKIHCLD